MKMLTRCFFLLLMLTATKGMTLDTQFQSFLDNHQYTQNNILRYEEIFGEGFISTGGLETTREFVALLNLQPGQKVLDVGCGIGGGDFYMEEVYSVQVIGIDLSKNVIQIANEKKSERGSHITFEVADVTSVVYPPESFDVIYSRDTLLHITDKASLFKKFYTWLKPGGQVMISDYCCSSGEKTQEFLAYVKKYDYTFLELDTYRKVLEKAGFVNAVAEDRTPLFVKMMKKELDKIEKGKEKFLKKFSIEDYDHLVDGWKAKLNRTTSGVQKWGLMRAHKA